MSDLATSPLTIRQDQALAAWMAQEQRRRQVDLVWLFSGAVTFGLIEVVRFSCVGW